MRAILMILAALGASCALEDSGLGVAEAEVKDVDCEAGARTCDNQVTALYVYCRHAQEDCVAEANQECGADHEDALLACDNERINCEERNIWTWRNCWEDYEEACESETTEKQLQTSPEECEALCFGWARIDAEECRTTFRICDHRAAGVAEWCWSSGWVNDFFGSETGPFCHRWRNDLRDDCRQDSSWCHGDVDVAQRRCQRDC